MNKNKPTFALLFVLLISFTAFSQTTIWEEDFSSYPDLTIDDSPRWTLITTPDINTDFTNTTLATYKSHFWVSSGDLEARDTNGNEQIFETENIDISSYVNVNIDINVSQTGIAENTDYINSYYVLDGGAETLFATNGQLNANFVSQTVSQTGLNGSTLKIVLRVNNSAQTEFHYINNILVQGIQSVSPGAVETDLQLWMRADKGIDALETVNNTEVTNWTDQSSNAYSATKETNGPVYIEESLNFNPALRFTRGDNTFLNLGQAANLDIKVGAGVTDRSDITIFAAFLTDGTGAGSIIAKGDNNVRSYQLWLGDTDRVVHYTWGRDQNGSPSFDSRNWGKIHGRNEPKLTTGTVTISGYKSYVNSIEDDMVFNLGVGDGASSSDVMIGARRNSGNSGSGNQLSGDVAEIIVYDRELNSYEIQKIETYLAIKYGITLGYNDEFYVANDSPQTTATGYSGISDDYIASNGSPLWIGANNAGYGYNVFGIARDDNSSLMQLKSKSSNVQRIENGPDDTTFLDAILTIESESGVINDDLSYLLIGHNGLDIALQNTSVPFRCENLLNRIWRSRESNTDTGETTLSFDLSQYTTTITNPEELHLIVGDDATFSGYTNYQGTLTGNVLTFTGVNLGESTYFTLGTPTEIIGSQDIYFDGTQSYIATSRMLGGKTQATIMGWIKPDSGFTSLGTIAGEENFYISLNNDLVPRVDVITNTGSYVTRNAVPADAINFNEWTHIAAVYKATDSSIKIYINGKESIDPYYIPTAPGTSLSTTIGTQNSYFSIGKDGAQYGTNFFKGDIDEVRVFDVALTENQIQKLVFQEMEQNGSNVRGTIIPKDIDDDTTSLTIPWSNVLAYYPMTVVKGNTVFDESINVTQASLKNIGNDIKLQTAPMPFTTVANGNLTTQGSFTNGVVWNINNLIDLDWSILKVSHDVTISNRMKNLGLFIDEGKSLTVGESAFDDQDFEINNSWYLELNGTLNLHDDSQLVQTENSDLVTGEFGKILRRQEGNINRYWYNYWSSPVGSLAGTALSDNNSTLNNANNTSFSVNMLKDENGDSLTFSTNWNNAVAGITSSYWLFTFQNGLTYNDWVNINETSAIQTGFGYTQKGNGGSGQYIFEGKPNNGTILIDADDVDGDSGNESEQNVTLTTTLIGNPYPSAIDAQKFIADNNGVISGTILLWEQWAGNSHYLAEYEGGYGFINNTTTVRAYQHADIPIAGQSQTEGIKRPTNFIPVSQGFFVEVINDGNIEFNNSQRVFIKESDILLDQEDEDYANNGSSFFRTSNTETNANTEESNPNQLIRLEFETSQGATRRFAIGFRNDATNGLDYGLDGGLILDKPEDDMGSLLNGQQYIIQALTPITPEKEVDLTLNASGNYTYSLKIVELQNIAEDQDIYLRDNLTNTYFDLRNDQAYDFNSDAGEFNDRFDIVFQSGNTLSNDELANHNTLIYINNLEDMLYVKALSNQANQLNIINMLGQTIQAYRNINNQILENGINISGLSSGTYIVSIKTENNLTIDKKVIIN